MANLINGLGGEAGFGENYLERNDDGSNGYDPVDLTSIFPSGINFFGQTWTGVYVNNNGNITFGNSLSSYTPTAIGANFYNPIIAPFWADVDTSNYYSDAIVGNVTPTIGGTSQGSNLTWYDIDTTTNTLTITWDDVGYYSAHTDKLNAFQLQLVSTGNGNFDIVYRYENIDWTTGDASDGTDGLGGTVARAGFSAGDDSNYYEFYFSGDQTFMLNLEDTLLAGSTEPGVWIYRVDGGSVQGLGLENSDDTVHGTEGSDIVDGRSGNDTLFAGFGDDTVSGGEGNDFLYAEIGDDNLIGGAGDDIIDGGEGLDTAMFSGNYEDYIITNDTGDISLSGLDGNDTLSNIERLQFSDLGLAFDMEGVAGQTAKILGAVFGSSAISNTEYAAIGLDLLDNGMSYDSLMDLALEAAGATSNEQIVDLLWFNLMGNAPTAAEGEPFIDMLNSNELTTSQLGVIAAESSFNTTNIDFTGLATSGLEYNIM